MRRIILLGFILFVGTVWVRHRHAATALNSTDLELTSDLQTALKRAQTEKKFVLLDFTGSDWCGWCIKLRKEVFATPTFASYASQHLVFVEVDFPQNKPQTAAVREQNQKLQERYSIEGYPTIVVLDPNGVEIGRLGYRSGGPQAWLEELKRVSKS